MSNYKTEWVEPSYGRCYMTKEDSEAFKNLHGPSDVILPAKQGLLVKYANQYPFNGDGKLYDLSNWEEYEESLPLTIKINAATQEEQKGKAQLIQTAASNLTNYQSAMIKGIPSASSKVKVNDVIENKQSSTRRKDEGVINSTGNQVKNTSIPTTPEVEEVANVVSDEFTDAKNKNESTIATALEEKLSSAKSKIKAKYAVLKSNFEDYKNQIEEYEKQIADLQARSKKAIGDAQAEIIKLSGDSQAAITKLQAEIVETMQEKLALAVEGIVGAFEGLGKLITTPLGFSAIVLGALGSEVGSTANAKVSNCTKLYPDGVKYDDCPSVDGYGSFRVGQFAGYQAQCYRPRNLSNTEDIDKAKEDAINFAKQTNGYVWNDCRKARFVVFYAGDDGE